MLDVVLREGGRGPNIMTQVSTQILLKLLNSQRAKQLERIDAKSTSEKLRREG